MSTESKDFSESDDPRKDQAVPTEEAAPEPAPPTPAPRADYQRRTQGCGTCF